MDTKTPEQRSLNMSRIKGKNTKPEMIVRSLLHRLGYRFRLHGKKLPGKPDIVLPRFKTVIFVHGCFWHRHPGCRRASFPAVKQDFWAKKFAANTERDRQATQALIEAGWKVLVVWECELKDIERLAMHLLTELPR